jgi:hypothetical protein
MATQHREAQNDLRAFAANLVQNRTCGMKTKLFAVAILLVASCLTTWAYPPMITQAKLNQIRIGQTTEADLVALFGTPTTRMVDIRRQVEVDWFRTKPMPAAGYVPLIGSFIGGLDIEAQQLHVLLSPAGRVLRFEARSSKNNLNGPGQQPSVRQAKYSQER